MSRLALILFGPPAAGKGTQAKMVGAALKIPVISTGDILREAVRNGTVLGKEAQRHMETGALVPDELVDAIVRERLQREDCAQGFILDGYPRTVHQAVFLESAFKDGDLNTQVVGIKVADDILIRRIAARRSCPKCGKVFSFAGAPNAEGAVCDDDGTRLIVRADDSVGVMKQRLEVYHRQTQPLVDYYKGRGWYVEVNGDQPVEKVNQSILEVVHSRVGAMSGAPR